MIASCYCCAQTSVKIYYPAGSTSTNYIYYLEATRSSESTTCKISCTENPKSKTTLEIPSTVMFGNTECTVTEIGSFKNKTNFVGDLIIPNTVKTIQDNAFENCTGFNGTLYLPPHVYLNNKAFIGNLNFTSIIISEGVDCHTNGFSNQPKNDYEKLETIYIYVDISTLPNKVQSWLDNFKKNNNVTIITPENMNTVVSAPTFEPKSGAYTGSFNVTISCATVGATIYYTTDGTVPTTSSTQYTGPITVDENTTIKAYAVKEKLTPIHSQATYTIINSINPPTFSPAEGTYTTAQSVSLTSTEGATIYYTTDGSDPTTSTSRKTYSEAVQIDGETNIKAVAFKDNQYSSVSTALYHFHVETPTFSPETNTVIEGESFKVTLNCNTIGATIYYTTNGDTPTKDSTPYTGPITVNENTTIKAYAVKNGYEDSYEATAVYTKTRSVLTPTLSPAGGTFTGSISVTISSEEGAAIYYTTNGETPTKDSTPYTGPITLSEPTSINAIAYKTGMTESGIATGVYNFNLPAPTFSVVSGTYNTVQNVEINCTTEGATIYYTTDGSEPTSSSKEYTSAVTIDGTTTLKAIAVKEDWINSSVTEAEYTLKVAAITYTPDPSKQFDEETTVTLTCEGATIYYTIDSTDPTNESTPYTNSITITKTTNIKAIAVRDGWEDSDMIDLWYKKFITVGEPVFNPDNNQALLETTAIEITCTVPNQEDQVYTPTIYYTLDGTTPTTESIKYTGPITISGPTTIKAFGMVNDYNNIANSPVITKRYDFKVAQPTITAGGSFTTSPQTVTIGCTTEGASIYYTTDGSNPTTSTTGKTIASGSTIDIKENTTVKAIAVKEEWISSDAVEATYEFNVECPSITPSCTFEHGKSITINLSCNTNGSTIYYTTDGSDPTPESAVCNGEITLSETKTIKAIACKEGWNSSQIVSATYTEKNIVSIPTLSLTPGKYNTIQECIVKCATEGATIYYSINGGDYEKIEDKTINITQSTSISAYAVKEGMTDSPIISETYTLEAPMPTFEPKGAKYTVSQNVTISATMDATIYYTTNGEVPTNASTPYTGPISISEPTTINAIAYIEGWEMSQVVTEIYDFYEKVANPVISPESGNSYEDIDVTISCVDGAKIYYTINGNEPDIYNNNNYTFVYNANTTITAIPTETTIIKAIAVKDGMLPSDIITANYNDNAILTFIGVGSWYTAENWNRGYVPSSKARVAISGDLVIYSEEKVNAFYINNIGSSLFTGGTITIEDGGQLIYNTADIKNVKIKKEITGYGNDINTAQGWYAFSTPISGTINSYENLTNGDYDLFSYNETDWHWHNYKTGEFNSLNLGQGYLYANSVNTTIISKGIPNNSNISFKLSANSNPDNIENNAKDYDLTGFNLVGNPFTFNIGKGANQAINSNLLKPGYYVLTTDGKWTAVDDTEPIKVGTSIFVETTEGTSANGINITIDNIPYQASQPQESKRGMSESESLSIIVSNEKYNDVAYIHFGNDTKNGLRKLAHINEDVQMVYVPINGIHYAIANVDNNVREVPIAFDASIMGKYTISIDASKCNHEEIYLIDNLSNEKIDIINNDYTFIATSSGNKERFTLLFTGNNDESSNNNTTETFAYICNGDIIISDIEGSGNVYVYDIMGRPVLTRNANGNANIPTSSLSDGIYIIRLIDDNGIKTQKITIK